MFFYLFLSKILYQRSIILAHQDKFNKKYYCKITVVINDVYDKQVKLTGVIKGAISCSSIYYCKLHLQHGFVQLGFKLSNRVTDTLEFSSILI
jgi:hypothetical protein